MKSRWDADLAKTTTDAFVAQGVNRDLAIRTYKNRRDIPAEDATSRLSPHLHWGEIGPRQVWAAVHRRQAAGQQQIERQSRLQPRRRQDHPPAGARDGDVQRGQGHRRHRGIEAEAHLADRRDVAVGGLQQRLDDGGAKHVGVDRPLRQAP